ncbi:MAG: rhomboid family intramembrane serine protease [Acidobacteriota bacterium]
MIPIKDDNPTRRFAWLTLLLIAANTGVFALEVLRAGGLLSPVSAEPVRALVETFGMVPARLFASNSPLPGWLSPPALLTFVTSSFLHADLLHLLGNMLYLWIFGNNIEDVMGRGRFLVFYLVCGSVAALSQALTQPASLVPMIGASGAVAGVLGAYLVRFPRAKVLVLVFFFFFVRLVRIPALIMLGLWFLFQVAYAGQGAAGIAWYAHIGGFVAGALLLHLFAEPRHRRRR